MLNLLTRCNHFRQNITRKLQELKYSDSVSTEILNDIFGCREGIVYFIRRSNRLYSNSEEFNEMILMKERRNQAEGSGWFYNTRLSPSRQPC